MIFHISYQTSGGELRQIVIKGKQAALDRLKELQRPSVVYNNAMKVVGGSKIDDGVFYFEITPDRYSIGISQ